MNTAKRGRGSGALYKTIDASHWANRDGMASAAMACTKIEMAKLNGVAPKFGSPTFSAASRSTRSIVLMNCCHGVTLKLHRNRGVRRTVGRRHRTLTV